MPATKDFTKGLPGGGYPQATPNSKTIATRVNFAKLGALTAGQTAKIGMVPANFVVTERYAFVRTAQGGTCTVNFGTAADADGFLVGANGNATANSNAGGTVGAITDGTLFATDTEIWIEFGSGTVSTAIVDFVLRGFMLPAS